MFETLTVLNSPGEYIHYFRLRQGMTTRQLSEKLHITPVTVLSYEKGRFPLPYETAVMIQEVLKIPSELILDEYCSFIGYPYTRRLQMFRKSYHLSQAEFAKQADIAPGVYAKWESGYRRPSRKMFQKLKTVYPEI